MKRRADWPERLAEFLGERREMPFRWGVNDCALFACAAIEVMTGMDPAAAFRGQYSTARGAARKMSAYGGCGLEEVAEQMAREHGFEEIAVGLAGRGDAVLLDHATFCDADEVWAEAISRRYSLGIVGPIGATAFFMWTGGLVELPVSACRRAWRVA